MYDGGDVTAPGSKRRPANRASRQTATEGGCSAKKPRREGDADEGERRRWRWAGHDRGQARGRRAVTQREARRGGNGNHSKSNRQTDGRPDPEGAKVSATAAAATLHEEGRAARQEKRDWRASAAATVNDDDALRPRTGLQSSPLQTSKEQGETASKSQTTTNDRTNEPACKRGKSVGAQADKGRSARAEYNWESESGAVEQGGHERQEQAR